MSMENKTKILVTGGAGNVGGALVKKLISNETNFVIVVDNLSTGYLSKLPSDENKNWKFIKADANNYREISSIMLSYSFDYVFHFAAVVGVIRTQENPVSVLDDISGIKHILSLSKNSSVKHVYFSSSSEVYGEPVELPQHEHRTPLNSRVPYAVVKNVGECFFRSYEQEFGLPHTIFRFFNTYGPSQSTDFVVSKFLASALKHIDITIYGDGLQTRTFTYVDDTVDTCLAILNKKLLKNDVVNIGSDKLMTVLELAQLIIKITNSKSKIKHVDPLKEGDMTRRQPDNTVMKKILGRELISVEEGIKRMMNDTKYLTSIGL
jgi:UDP-glucuronate decarboxylase